MQYSSIFFSYNISYIRLHQRLLMLSCFHSSESIHSKRYDHHKHVKSCIKVWPTSWAKSNFRPKLMGIAKTSASYRIVSYRGDRCIVSYCIVSRRPVHRIVSWGPVQGLRYKTLMVEATQIYLVGFQMVSTLFYFVDVVLKCDTVEERNVFDCW